MENKGRTQTFLGFAVRAGKFRTGFNSVASLKKVYLLVVCRTASENSLGEAKKLAKKFNCPLIKTEKETLEEIIYKHNAKIMAVTDKSLALAAKADSEKDFITVQE